MSLILLGFTKYQRYFSIMLLVMISDCLRLMKILNRYSRFHPDLRSDSFKKESIIDRLRKNLRYNLPIRHCRHPPGILG